MIKRNCLVLLLSCAVSSVWGEDWPQWRGPNRDAIWNAEGIVDQLPVGQMPLEWSVDIGPGYSGPTVADGRVYITDRLIEDGNRQLERILCFDSATGKKVWSQEYEASYQIGYTAGPRASVTVVDGLAYSVGAMGHFYCLNAATGEIVWSRDLSQDYQIEMPIWGIAAAPLAYGNLIIQQVGGADGATVVAFDRMTGKEVWKSLNERIGYSSPVITQQNGKDVLVVWTGESLSGLDPTNGVLFWAHPMPPTRMPIGIATPSMDRDLIYVSSFYDGSLMLRALSDQTNVELVWRILGPDEQKTKALHSMIGTPIVQDGYVYGFDSYGQFRCLNALTGERIWESQDAVPKARWSTVHMVRQADRVWMFNERGELLLTKVSPQGLEILSRSQLIQPTSDQLSQRGGVCWSHPAFAEQSVFARNDKQLVKSSLAKPK